MRGFEKHLDSSTEREFDARVTAVKGGPEPVILGPGEGGEALTGHQQRREDVPGPNRPALGGLHTVAHSAFRRTIEERCGAGPRVEVEAAQELGVECDDDGRD